MHWTPLSGAPFEDAFGHAQPRSRVRRRRTARRAHPLGRRKLTIECLEEKAVPATTTGTVWSSLAVPGLVAPFSPTWPTPGGTILWVADDGEDEHGTAHGHDHSLDREYILIEFQAPPHHSGAGDTDATGDGEASPMNPELVVGGPDVGSAEASITDLVKAASNATPAVGERVTYTLSFANAAGGATAYGVRVRDALPAGLALHPASVRVVGGTGLVNRSGGNLVDVSLQAVAPGGTVTITYDATVTAASTILVGEADVASANLAGSAAHAETLAIIPLGAVTPAITPGVNSISGLVFGDTDENGSFNAGDALLANVPISLVNETTGLTVAMTITAGNGTFVFGNLPDGTYALVQTQQPPGYNDGIDFPGSAGGAALPVPGDTIGSITLAGGVNATGYLFGECPCPPAQLSGFVYEDFSRAGPAPTDNNGVFDRDVERPIPGVTVTLTDLSGNEVADFSGIPVGPAVTDANGFYQFTNLRSHVGYRVVETQPAGYRDGADTPGTTGGRVGPNGGRGSDFITEIPLEPGDNSQNNNFGELLPLPVVRPASISGHVYCDLNTNGVFDVGDTPIAGAVITLTGGPGAPARTAMTNDRGEYFFSGLAAGTYRLRATQPPGTLDGIDRAGTVNGQVRGTAGNDVIAGIVLAGGDRGVNFDFGEICPPPPRPPIGKALLLASTPLGNAPPVVPPGTVPTTPTFANARRNTGGDTSRPHFLVTGTDAGAAPFVRVFDFSSGTVRFQFFPYSPAFFGGVRVATGDVTGDGVPDVITAPGRGGGPHIKVFSGADGRLLNEFLAFAPTFRGGVFVTVADVDGDGRADVVTGADAGGTPRVRAFNALTAAVVSDFLAYDANFRGGVRVAAGNFTGDGRAEIVTAPGAGGGPHVKVFGAGGSLLRQFMAFGPAARAGLFVSVNPDGAGDVNGDGRRDLVVAGGGGTDVRVFTGPDFSPVTGFAAFAPGPGGVRVGVFDLDGDGRDDVIAGAGPGRGAFVRVVSVTDGRDLEFFQAYSPLFLGGVFVAGA